MTSDRVPSPCIGVFDSGVGGLSVLDALRRRLPNAPLIYLGDVAYAPYGERTSTEVIERCDRIVARLVALGARAIVIACNTATVLAIATLRARWPSLVFIGVEPGVKPAAQRSATRRIAVMATPATARSARLRFLIDEFARGLHVHVQACAGLADAIERGVQRGPELQRILAPLCAEIRAANVDTVVLGCTHYPFVADEIQSLLGGGHALIDTAVAVAGREGIVLRLPPDSQASLRVFSSGATTAMSQLLTRCRHLEAVSVEAAPI